MRLILSASLAGVALLAGCAYPNPQHVAALNTLVGKSETDLVRAHGVPTRTYETGGRKFLSYNISRIESIPGDYVFWRLRPVWLWRRVRLRRVRLWRFWRLRPRDHPARLRHHIRAEIRHRPELEPARQRLLNQPSAFSRQSSDKTRSDAWLRTTNG